MGRVNLDGKVWKDPRVRRLAKRCGWSMRETVGTLAAIWDVATDLRSEVMDSIDIDTAAETDGFAARMMADDVQLGDPEPDGRVRLHGVRERIEFLLKQAERGRAGGLARAANAKPVPTKRQANAKQAPSERLAQSKHHSSLPPDTAPDLDLGKDKDPAPDPDMGSAPEFDPFAATTDDMTGPEPQWWGNPPRPPAAAPPPAKPKAKRKASQMPEGWMPEPYTVPPNVDPKLELARFRDWAAAKAATFVDWNAAWRNWLRKAAEFAPRRGPGPGREPETALQVAIRLAGEA